MELNQTPGPWAAGVSKWQGAEHISVCSAVNKSKIVAICGFAGAGDEPESIANAYLITAAPTMLLMLKRLYSIEMNADISADLGKLIALAEGKTQ